jgi:hypothetical protein
VPREHANGARTQRTSCDGDSSPASQISHR